MPPENSHALISVGQINWTGDNNNKIISPVLVLNPEVDWENIDEVANKNFDANLWGNSTAESLITHELTHLIEAQNNIPAFYDDDFAVLFEENEKKDAYKVSKYAAKNRTEFVAEYVSGKFAGKNYPKCTDDLFQKYWRGPEIDFSIN